MVDQMDQERVCCLCGDVGFSDRLFQCSRCHFRLQHSYCSNYYCGNMEVSSPSSSSICDWCQSELSVGSNRNGMMISGGGSNSRHSKSSSTMINSTNNSGNYGSIRSEYSSGERIKNHGDHHHHHHHHHHTHQTIKVSSPSSTNNPTKNSGVPSPRPNSHRRYKLLKDVMC